MLKQIGLLLLTAALTLFTRNALAEQDHRRFAEGGGRISVQ